MVLLIAIKDDQIVYVKLKVSNATLSGLSYRIKSVGVLIYPKLVHPLTRPLGVHRGGKGIHPLPSKTVVPLKRPFTPKMSHTGLK